jgi:peroxiredoxin
MKKIILSLFILAFFGGVTTSLILAPKTSTQTQQTSELPDLTLENITGKNINLNKDVSNKTILLFYLPKSSSCKEQLEILQQIKNEYQNSISIYGISIGDIDITKLKNIKKENRISYPLLIDKKAKISEKLLINTIPTLIFINSQGKIIEKNVGLMTNKELKQNLNSMVNKENNN